MGGLSHMTGSPDRPPARVCVDQAHVIAGSQAAMGAMIAHYYREATGIGQHVDVSIQESVVPSALTLPQAWDLARSLVWPREGAFLPSVRQTGAPSLALQRRVYRLENLRRRVGGKDAGPRRLDGKRRTQPRICLRLTGRKWITRPSPSKNSITGKLFLAGSLKVTRKAELCSEALSQRHCAFPSEHSQRSCGRSSTQGQGFWETIDYPELGRPHSAIPAPYISLPRYHGKFDRAPLIGEHNSEMYEAGARISKESSPG